MAAVQKDIALIVASKITTRKYNLLTLWQLSATSFSAATIFVTGIIIIECAGHIILPTSYYFVFTPNKWNSIEKKI